MTFAVGMRELLEAGVHFGHQTRRWDPRMKPYIYTSRNDIHVIDLRLSLQYLEKAYNYVRDLVANGGKIVFVGTKKQAQEAVAEEAKRCGMPYVTNRWLGGSLTNLSTIRKSVRTYKKLMEQKQKGIFEKLSSKEVARLNKQLAKMDTNLGGILEMSKLPQAVFVVDTIKEDIAIKEARRLKIPVVGVIDTNSNPHLVDIKIPGNDDAIRAIRLLVGTMANACIEGNRLFIEKTGGTAEDGSDINEQEILAAAIEKESQLDDVDSVMAASKTI